jgi:hypothetical protein
MEKLIKPEPPPAPLMKNIREGEIPMNQDRALAELQLLLARG